MKRRAMRGAAAALCLLAPLAGCGGTSGDQDLSGSWQGSLTLTFAGGGGLGGGLQLQLDQRDSFASGSADWDPVSETMSISGPVTGTKVTLNLVFQCLRRFETTRLTGTVSGDTLSITDAEGKACSPGSPSVAVDGASASLTRTSNNVPL